jgi:hypothetical protein
MTKFAGEWLEESRNILDQRGKDYDTSETEASGGERSMGKTVDAFNIITGRDLKESEGWLLMQLVKDVRQWTKPDFHEDSALDCISYAALKAEALEAESLEAELHFKANRALTKAFISACDKAGIDKPKGRNSINEYDEAIEPYDDSDRLIEPTIDFNSDVK